MIIQNASIDGFTDLTFTVSRKDIGAVRRLLEISAKEVGAQGLQFDEHIAKVSIVGVGMRSHAGAPRRCSPPWRRKGSTS